MPQSLTKLYAHLIFSTKNRQPLIDEDIRPRVHGYLATTLRDMACPYVVVGGVADHDHLLFDMGKMHAPKEFVEHMKRESSKFVKTLGQRYRKCGSHSWGDAPGYGDDGLRPRQSPCS